MKSSKDSAGFTLIELMIVVAIIGILAAIAYPSYQEQVKKSRRADAMAALTNAAAMQERIFTEKNSYTSVIADIGGATSDEGYYTISVVAQTIDNATSCVSGTYMPCYKLTAKATGVQAGDTKCDEFFLDSTGKKTAENSANVDATDVCWIN